MAGKQKQNKYIKLDKYKKITKFRFFGVLNNKNIHFLSDLHQFVEGYSLAFAEKSRKTLQNGKQFIKKIIINDYKVKSLNIFQRHFNRIFHIKTSVSLSFRPQRHCTVGCKNI